MGFNDMNDLVWRVMWTIWNLIALNIGSLVHTIENCDSKSCFVAGSESASRTLLLFAIVFVFFGVYCGDFSFFLQLRFIDFVSLFCVCVGV